MPNRLFRNPAPVACLSEPPRLGMDSESLALDFSKHYGITLARDRHCQSIHYAYNAIALTVRDRLMERWKDTNQAYDQNHCRQAYYVSMEFLMGRAFGNAVLNLGIEHEVSKAVFKQTLNLEDLADAEHDAGLGNGGLGRLAACLIDSCATLQLPVRGYGIRYEYGMFRQRIENGYQVEEPDHWLREGHVWELERPELTQRVHFGGRTEFFTGSNGEFRVRWIDTHDVFAVPYDNPVPGYQNGTVNTLRLWKSAATDEFDLDEFNAGSYPESVAQKNSAEHISMVLYPNDASENGKELRLKQQYFLASASLQDVIRTWVQVHGDDFSNFVDKNCFQLNDTHPSIAVAELMRLLMDAHGLGWDRAWEITRRTMAYTNHTLLPEALEKWPVRLFRQLLPRLLEIIFEINARFIAEVARRWPGDNDRLAAMSLIEEGAEPQIRMAYLAIVGSFSMNGVAELHSRLLQQGLFKDFYELWPHKFNNKTNGITPRRWIVHCNPKLTELITETIGDDWIRDLSRLRELAPFAENAEFRKRWRAIKQYNKRRLLEFKNAELGIEMNACALFDVQVKRIHEYKRQLLNALHVIHLYDRIKRGDTARWVSRCILIGGKAAPGYAMAKLIIKLINNVASVVNQDPEVQGLLKLCFIPNYRVSAMEMICPAADLSEQISTAGKEASGTGNMKFMMNGAITIGTLDGANIEIREEVGDENFFLFGLTAEEVESMRGNYHPNSIIELDPDLKRVMDLIECGHFSQFEPKLFAEIIHGIRSEHDPWMTAADFRSFVDTQKRVSETFTDTETWARMSILNCAASGKFSSDRTIAEYNKEIWRLESVSPEATNPC
ncbi:MAG: glycogen/starch/alpha-glucan phosphorylase [Methylococcales bacterium]